MGLVQRICARDRRLPSAAALFRVALFPAAWIVAALFSGGCQTDLFKAQRAYQAGDLQRARSQINAYRKQVGENQHAVIALLESGSILQTAGDLEGSLAALKDAESRFDQIDDNQAARAGDEVISAITNPQEVVYPGKPYDRVMSPIYRAINLMALGRTGEARQTLFVSQNWQDRAIQAYNQQIEQAQQELTDEQQRQARKVQNDAGLQQTLAEIYGDLDAFEAYAGYSNPFADLLFAVYLLGTFTERGDGELARNYMRRVAGMNPGVDTVRRLLDLADEASKGNKPPPAVHVFLLTGTAPMRSQQRIDLPLFLVVGGGNLNYAGVAFPKLQFNPRYVQHARVHTSGLTTQTRLIADFDRIVAADFKAELPTQITRTIVGAIAKASAAYAINQATRGRDDPVRAIAQIGTLIYQAAQNQADKRTWATLPKQVQHAWVPVPVNGVIELTEPYGAAIWRAEGLHPNKTHLIFVRSIGPGIPAWVRHVELQ